MEAGEALSACRQKVGPSCQRAARKCRIFWLPVELERWSQAERENGAGFIRYSRRMEGLHGEKAANPDHLSRRHSKQPLRRRLAPGGFDQTGSRQAIQQQLPFSVKQRPPPMQPPQQ
jgi:hypothetical protein